MKRTVLTLTMMLMTVLTALAQRTIVKAVVVDSTLQEAEPYATVRIYKAQGKEPVAQLLTDLDGCFQQEVKGRGQYTLAISSVGKRDLVRQLTLDGEGTLDLGTLLLHEDSQMLQGVEIVAQKPLVKMEVDKMSYNVQEDADSKSATVLDMLRKVPMVSVDGQDNITVNGSSSFKVYVDGKPNVMMSSAPSQVFKSMPATAVKSIEVVTNPGARYDAEGTGGVLNIVMNKDMGAGAADLNGYNGTLRASAGNKSLGGSAFVNGQQGRLSYSANVMYNYAKPGTTHVTMEREQLSAGSSILMESATKARIPFTMGNLTLGYEVDSMSSIGLSAAITRMNMNNTGRSTTTLTGQQYGGAFGYGYDLTLKNKRTSFNGSLDYQRFLNPQRTSSLALTYQLTYSPTAEQQRNDFDGTEQNYLDLTDRYSDDKEKTTEHIAQADLTLALAEGQTLNTGAKLTARTASSDSKYYLQDLYTESLSMDYSHQNTILAGYAELDSKYGKWGTKLGLRYEQTWQDVEYRLGNGQDFTKNYGNLVPSASLSYSIAPTQNIGLTYNMRISRPGISYLNPYVDRSNPTALTYGNTDLDAEKSHNIGLVYNLFTPKLMLNVNLRQSLTDNGIEQYSFYQDNLLHTTYGNMAKRHQTSLNVYANWLLHKNTRLFMNGGVDYTNLRSTALDTRNHGWHANAMMGLQQTLPADVKLGMFLITSTKSYSLQGWNSGFNMLSANVSKSFFQDKLNVSLMAITGLSSGGNLNIENYSHGTDFTNHMQVKVPMHGFTVSVSYSFGNTKKQFQQRQTRVESDYMEQQSQGEMINNAQMGGN